MRNLRNIIYLGLNSKKIQAPFSDKHQVFLRARGLGKTYMQRILFYQLYRLEFSKKRSGKRKYHGTIH